MGGQVSTIKAAAAGKFAAENKKKKKQKERNKGEKAKIGILAFEVANVMSKSIQLWQSLSDEEMLRLRTEVIKAEGVLNLVSDNEAILLSLACMEKLQDLTAVANAVARLGQRCQEPALQAFEHVYNDILEQSIDVRALEYPCREMESKMRKMERYIAATANLYQELEILSDLEQAVRRLQEVDQQEVVGTHNNNNETLSALEQKAIWQRQEIKYVRDLSLWNRTFDKIVSLLARTICTIHGRIVGVFGSPMLGLSHAFHHQQQQNGESSSSSSPHFANLPTYCLSHSQTASLSPRQQQYHHKGTEEAFLNHDDDSSSSFRIGSVSQSINTLGFSAHVKDGGPSLMVSSLASQTAAAAAAAPGSLELWPSPPPNLSSGPHITQRRNSVVCYSPNFQKASPCAHLSVAAAAALVSENTHRRQFFETPLTALVQAETTDSFTSALLYATSHSIQPGQSQQQSGAIRNGRNVRILCDPKTRHQMAPWSTLGGAALALHYSNVIIILERMIRYPHLIAPDARDDLYRMLPKSVRGALRSRLRVSSIMRLGDNSNSKFNSEIAAGWKEALERLISWLAPLAHNMIRWQSEHNFEQQQVVARTNVLLLQTLYFADLVKTELAITELLVGLNYIMGLEQETKLSNHMTMEEDEEQQQDAHMMVKLPQEDSEEYISWQF